MKPIAQVAADLRHLPARDDVSSRARRVPFSDPRKEADAAYRQAWGKKGKAPYGKPLRAAFYQFLGESPRGRYVSRETARRYTADIQRVLDMEQWTKEERNRLHELHRKWTRRAEGHDARFNAVGVTGGVTEKNRPKTGRDIIANIWAAIEASAGRKAAPVKKFVVDAGWPLGKPNPDRRV